MPEQLGAICSEGREQMTLNEIIDALRNNAQLVSEVWFLVKTNELSQGVGAKPAPESNKLDLPRSVNKLDCLSKDRLEFALEMLRRDVDMQSLKDMTKQSLCRWLGWATHVEEGSAAPSKVFAEILTGVKNLYVICGGKRLEGFPITMSPVGDARARLLRARLLRPHQPRPPEGLAHAHRAVGWHHGGVAEPALA